MHDFATPLSPVSCSSAASPRARRAGTWWRARRGRGGAPPMSIGRTRSTTTSSWTNSILRHRRSSFGMASRMRSGWRTGDGFAIPSPLRSSSAPSRSGRGAATEAEQAAGSFSLAAGEVEEIEFVPLQAGTYPLECTKPLHGLFGMTGDIVVQ